MRDAPVDDDRRVDSLRHRRDAGLHLGDHAARNRTVRDQRGDVGGARVRSADCLRLFSTPGTSVSNRNRAAPKATAIAPAHRIGVDVVGVPVLASADRRDDRDHDPRAPERIEQRAVDVRGFADEPQIDLMLDRGCRSAPCRSSLRAVTSPASLPEMPTARPPAAWMSATISLLIDPAKHHLRHSARSPRSVTRSPSTNSLFTPNRFSIAPICGPPPCTTTGLMPTAFKQHDIAAQTPPRARASPIACPPYFTTNVRPGVALEIRQRLDQSFGFGEHRGIGAEVGHDAHRAMVTPPSAAGNPRIARAGPLSGFCPPPCGGSRRRTPRRRASTIWRSCR